MRLCFCCRSILNLSHYYHCHWRYTLNGVYASQSIEYFCDYEKIQMQCHLRFLSRNAHAAMIHKICHFPSYSGRCPHARAIGSQDVHRMKEGWQEDVQESLDGPSCAFLNGAHPQYHSAMGFQIIYHQYEKNAFRESKGVFFQSYYFVDWRQNISLQTCWFGLWYSRLQVLVSLNSLSSGRSFCGAKPYFFNIA